MHRSGRFVLAAVGLCMLASVATPQQPNARALQREKANRDWEYKWRAIRRANLLKPVRRDEPPRELNISDNEVREVQEVSQRYLPREFVNISTVVSGCPCEEGPECTDQVFVVATSSADSRGLQLSHVKGKWIVGVVQKWWLKYDALLVKRPTLDVDEFDKRETALALEFPECGLGSQVALEPAKDPDGKAR